jgi:hypothetical protein
MKEDGAFLAELKKELSPGHVLHGQALRPLARRDANDDVLFIWDNEPSRFTVVHLTWSGHAEQKGFPFVEYDGNFEGFLAHEHDAKG